MRCKSWTTKPDFTYLHHIYQISSIQALHTFQHPFIQETTKFDHNFILYIQNFLDKMGRRYCTMRDINETKQ